MYALFYLPVDIWKEVLLVMFMFWTVFQIFPNILDFLKHKAVMDQTISVCQTKLLTKRTTDHLGQVIYLGEEA